MSAGPSRWAAGHRALIPIADVAQWMARGFVEVYRIDGGMRHDGPMAVMSWTPGATTP